MKRVAIVGAGIAGCALAYELCKLGARVTLLEEGRVALQGASSGPIALLNPLRGFTAHAGPYDVRGLAATWQLVAELERAGADAGATRSGVLRIASSARQAQLWRGRHRRLWLDASAVPPEYHAPFGALLVADGGWLLPAKLLGALRSRVEAMGSVVREKTRALALVTGERSRGVVTSQGPVLAHEIVLCTGSSRLAGAFTPDLACEAGDILGVAVRRPLPYPLAGTVYGAQHLETFYFGGNRRPAAADDPQAAAKLIKAMSWFVRDLGRAEAHSQWTGVRAVPPDRRPLQRQLPCGAWFLGGFGGRGFLTAPLFARELARRILA